MIVFAHQSFTEAVAFPILVGLAGAVFGALIAGRGALAQRRRDRFASAAETLAAWAEMPYRIRRRTSDAPDVLSALASRAHDVQEQLANHRAWMQVSSTTASEAFTAALDEIDEKVRPAMKDAWHQPPITEPSGMNLDGWGPGSCQTAIDDFVKRSHGKWWRHS